MSGGYDSIDPVDDDQYMTQAVESGVYDEDDDLIGHVGLLDLDGVGREQALGVADRLPGVSAVLASSPDSYHVWSLSLRSLVDWIDIATSLDPVDDEHISISESRDCQVLRIDAKREVATGEIVKTAPALFEISTSGTILPQSWPHARILSDRFATAIPEIDEASRWVGDSTDERTYLADIGGR